MHLILIFFMLFFTASFVGLIFKRKIEETVAIACFLYIIILYIFGLFGILHMGIYACVAISSIGFFCFIWYAIRNKNLLIQNIFTTGLLVFACLFIFVWFAQGNRLLSSWDEFSHWGLVVKNMYIFDSFGNHPEATTMFKGYPPATALFQYLWCKLFGSYQDTYLIRAINILSFSLFLPIFKKIDCKNKKSILPILLIILILPLVFYNGFFTQICVDAILGILFAYILFSYFSSKEIDSFCLLNIILSSFVLSLTKASGVGLSILALVIITIDMIAFKREPKLFKVRNPQILRSISIIFILISILIAKYSWSVYLKITNTSVAWSEMKNLTILNVIELFMHKAPAYRYIVYENFIKALFNTDFYSYTINMKFYSWLTLFSIVGLLLLRILKDELFHRRIKIAILSLFGGSLVYTASMLFLYMFTYSEYEAQNLASFQRYLSTYLLGMLVFLVLMLINSSLDRKNEQSHSKYILLGTLISTLIFTNLTPLMNVTFLSRQSIMQSIAFRAPYMEINRIANTLNSKKDRLYFISQNSNGLDYYIAQYNLTPIKTVGCWSIGTPYGDSDIWTSKITCEQWLDDLSKNYTYIYLYNIDEQFKNEFGDAFEKIDYIKNNSLFKIIKIENKVKLQYVDI